MGTGWLHWLCLDNDALSGWRARAGAGKEYHFAIGLNFSSLHKTPLKCYSGMWLPSAKGSGALCSDTLLFNVGSLWVHLKRACASLGCHLPLFLIPEQWQNLGLQEFHEWLCWSSWFWWGLRLPPTWAQSINPLYPEKTPKTWNFHLTPSPTVVWSMASHLTLQILCFLISKRGWRFSHYGIFLKIKQRMFWRTFGLS